MKPYLARFFHAIIILSAVCLMLHTAHAQTGKPPVIIIPGITGSQLVKAETGKTVWFTLSLGRGETDDLRLPMSPNLAQNRDAIIAKDIIRDVKLPGIFSIFPDIHIYDEALKALTTAGYSEATWENPQAADCFYVFAYDWRRDNVESAQLLIQKIEAVKAKLNRPDLKFDIAAHSMGGMVARYAAMYGKSDLPAGDVTPNPTWAGAPHIERLLLFGTPSEGSFSAFETLIKGYKIGGRVLSFDDLTEDDVFTIPALYQLLPYGASVQVLDENLKPISVDLYDPDTWRKYGWGAIGSPKFLARLKGAAQAKDVQTGKGAKTIDDQIHAEATYAQASEFLAVVLRRALKFHQALSVKTAKSPIETLIYGGNCQDTLSAIVIVYKDKKNTWETVTTSRDVKTSSGREISKEQIKKAIYAVGDGRVTERSLLAEAATSGDTARAAKPGFPVKSSFFACVAHAKLLNSSEIQEQFLPILSKRLKELPR